MYTPERSHITPTRRRYQDAAETGLQLDSRRAPTGASETIAYAFVKVLRFTADTFFAKRYGNRAVVLETVAAVPGMVGGALQHLRRHSTITASC